MLGSLVTLGAGLLSGAMGAKSSERAGELNYAAQKEFAQNGMQWRAEDARLAGLHPLAVLGSAGASFSPSFTGAPGPDLSALGGLFDDMDSMKEQGQDTTRAQRASMTGEQREMQAAQIRNQQLQNALLEGQLAEQWGKVMGQPSNPPAPGPSKARPTPRSGQANTGEVVVRPSESEATRINDAGVAAGSSPLFRDQKISNNRTWTLLSPEIGETFEAYGEIAKPFMAGAAHAARWYDNAKKHPRKYEIPVPRIFRKRTPGATGKW